LVDFLDSLVKSTLPKLFQNLSKNCIEIFVTNEVQAVLNLCKIMHFFIIEKFKLDFDNEINKRKLSYILAQACIWGICLSYDTES